MCGNSRPVIEVLPPLPRKSKRRRPALSLRVGGSMCLARVRGLPLADRVQRLSRLKRQMENPPGHGHKA